MKRTRFGLLAALALVLGMAGAGRAQTTFVPTQTFAGTAGSDLNTYTGAGGVTWARNGAFAASTNAIALTANGRIRAGQISSSGAGCYYASPTPSGADYTVQADFYAATAPTASSDIAGICGRMSTSADTFYEAIYRGSIGGVALYKHVSGTSTQLGSTSVQAFTAGQTHTLQLKMAGTTISAIWDGTTVVTATDSAITAAGKVGVFEQSAATPSDSIGYQITNFSATIPAAAAATTYTLTKSASTGPTGTAVTLTYTPDGATTAVVTPAVSGVSGSFSASTVTLNGTTPVSVTFTPTSTGTAMFTSTNNGSLTDPASQTYTVTPPPITLGVTSPALGFSPGNWVGDTGRGGSVSRTTWNSGAYFAAAWTQPAGNATILVTNQTSGSTISYVLDGVLTDNVSVPTSGGISLSVLTSGSHTLTVYCRNSPQSNRWNLTNAWKVTGLSIDGSGAAGTISLWSAWVLVVGDSITEGIQANAGADSWLSDYSYALAQALKVAGYETGLSACGDSGGDVPGWYSVSGSSGGTGGTYSAASSRWGKISSGVSLFDANGHLSSYGGTGQEPAAILWEYGVNEAQNYSTYSTSDTQASVFGSLTAARAAAPNAWLFVGVPPGLYNTAVATYSQGPTYIAAIKAGVGAYQAANPSDAKVKLIDLGGDVALRLGSALYKNSDGVHPSAAGHAYIAPMIAAPVLTALTGATAGISIRSTGEVGRGR